MRVALYARFSSDAQDASLSIGAQLNALHDHALKNGCEVCDEHIYIDEAQSALSDNRPEFKRMIASAKKSEPPFEAILVWKLNRFARSRQDSVLYKSLLQSRGIKVTSISEPIDSETPQGRLFEGILEVLDEFYSSNLAQDTMRGMIENAKRGYFNGGNVPFALKKKVVVDQGVERKTLEPDPELAPIVQRIFMLAANSTSLKSIVRTLNRDGVSSPTNGKWGTTSVRRILGNEIYAGTMIWNVQQKSKILGKVFEPVKAENVIPSIVSKKTFDKVQHLLEFKARHQRSPRSASSPYLLSEVLYCGQCGGSLTGASAHGKMKKKYFYYSCCTYQKQGKEQCDFKSVPRDEIENLVVDHIREGAFSRLDLERFVKRLNKRILSKKNENTQDLSGVESQIESCSKKLNRLYAAIETDEIDLEALAPRIYELRTQLKELQSTKLSMEQEIQESEMRMVDLDTVLYFFEHLKDIVDHASLNYKKFVFAKLIERAVVFPDRIEITTRIPQGKIDPEADGDEFEFRDEWYRGRDSNPHGLPQRILSPSCLPIPPPRPMKIL